MKYGTLTLALLLLSITSATHATTWTSPDGKISFDLPADGSLIEMKNPPAPATAMWTTADTNTRLMFVIVSNPQNTPLVRGGLEEGTLKGFPGATLLSSTETSVGSVPVVSIAAKINPNAYIQQNVMAFNNSVYKVMATAPTQISSDARLAGVYQSLKILDPAATPPVKNLSNHELSVTIAEVGWGVLLIAGIILYVRRSSRRKPNPPSVP